jgi:SpoVK/Ycf46/Vps4 family AAA+-type ATPase
MELKLSGVPNNGIDLQSFVERTSGYNGADMDYLCEKAKEFAIKRVITNYEAKKIICLEDFERAFATIRSSVLDADRIEMEKFIKNYGEEI